MARNPGSPRKRAFTDAPSALTNPLGLITELRYHKRTFGLMKGPRYVRVILAGVMLFMNLFHCV